MTLPQNPYKSARKELTRIPQNRSLLLRRTMIEYESESSRWTLCFLRCTYRVRARSAILRIVLQKIDTRIVSTCNFRFQMIEWYEVAHESILTFLEIFYVYAVIRNISKYH